MELLDSIKQPVEVVTCTATAYQTRKTTSILWITIAVVVCAPIYIIEQCVFQQETMPIESTSFVGSMTERNGLHYF